MFIYCAAANAEQIKAAPPALIEARCSFFIDPIEELSHRGIVLARRERRASGCCVE